MLRVNTLSGFGRINAVAGDDPVDAFLTATGIVDGTISGALDALYASLLADGIWAKCIAIYPFVGGSSSTHSYNLKDTAAYQISWGGTVTHDANGITPNGSSGYGNTGITPNTHLTSNNTHLSFYSRTNQAAADKYEMGSATPTDPEFTLFARNNLGRAGSQANTSSNSAFASNSDSSGFYIGSRRSTTDHELYVNGASFATDGSTNSTALPSSTIYVGGFNYNGALISASNKNLAFASVGASLTDTEAADFHTAVEAFQDALSRGVI